MNITRQTIAAISSGDLNVPNVQATGANLGNVLTSAFVIVGALAVVFIIFGGFQYITAGGDSSQISKAKNTILYAVIGVIVCLSASVIISFVGSTIK